MWTYTGPGSIDAYGDWDSVSGSFSLSTDSDQIFVYVGDEADPTFVFGLSTTPWVTDGSNIGTTDSVCPDQLVQSGVNASVAFSTVDNGAYYGNNMGTKDELLTSICSPQAWHTSDSTPFAANNTAFVVYATSVAPSPSPGDSSSSSNKIYGVLGENGFFGVVIAVALIIAVSISFVIWRYVFNRRKGPLSNYEDRDSIVEISESAGSGHDPAYLKT